SARHASSPAVRNRGLLERSCDAPPTAVVFLVGPGNVERIDAGWEVLDHRHRAADNVLAVEWDQQLIAASFGDVDESATGASLDDTTLGTLRHTVTERQIDPATEWRVQHQFGG